MSTQDARPAVYRDIPEYPGYRLGDDGSVWSQWVQGRWKQRRTEWRRLKTPLGTKGYPQVNLYQVETGTRVHFKLHVLVATIFLGPKPDGLVIRHLNGNQADNRVENLAYGTYADNAADAMRLGRTNRGRRCWAAKVDEDQVLDIRRRVKLGEQQNHLAAEFGLSTATINQIVKRKIWAHLGVLTDGNESR